MINEHLFENVPFKYDPYLYIRGKVYRLSLCKGTLHKVGKG